MDRKKGEIDKVTYRRRKSGLNMRLNNLKRGRKRKRELKQRKQDR